MAVVEVVVSSHLTWSEVANRLGVTWHCSIFIKWTEWPLTILFALMTAFQTFPYSVQFSSMMQRQ